MWAQKLSFFSFLPNIQMSVTSIQMSMSNPNPSPLSLRRNKTPLSCACLRCSLPSYCAAFVRLERSRGGGSGAEPLLLPFVPRTIGAFTAGGPWRGGPSRGAEVPVCCGESWGCHQERCRREQSLYCGVRCSPDAVKSLFFSLFHIYCCRLTHKRGVLLSSVSFFLSSTEYS